MGIANFTFRRGAIFTWRRRIPKRVDSAAVNLQVSLRTACPWTYANLVRFIVRPQVGADSNRRRRKNPVAGKGLQHAALSTDPLVPTQSKTSRLSGGQNSKAAMKMRKGH